MPEIELDPLSKILDLQIADARCQDKADPVTCIAKILHEKGFEEGEIAEHLKNKFNISIQEARKITENVINKNLDDPFKTNRNPTPLVLGQKKTMSDMVEEEDHKKQQYRKRHNRGFGRGL